MYTGEGVADGVDLIYFMYVVVDGGFICEINRWTLRTRIPQKYLTSGVEHFLVLCCTLQLLPVCAECMYRLYVKASYIWQA